MPVCTVLLERARYDVHLPYARPVGHYAGVSLTTPLMPSPFSLGCVTFSHENVSNALVLLQMICTRKNI
jgi:hypothetical protein